MWLDPTVDGLKTGHTNGAGYCLVASALRDSTRLVSVILGTQSIKERETQTAALLNYGFRFFQSVSFFAEGAVIEKARVWKGTAREISIIPAKPVNITVARNVAGNLKTDIHIEKPLFAPISKGQKLGQIQIKNGDTVISTIDAVAQDDVPRAGFFGVLWDTLTLLFSRIFGMTV